MRVASYNEQLDHRLGRSVSVCSFTGYDHEEGSAWFSKAARVEGPPVATVLTSTRSKDLLEWEGQQVDGIARHKTLNHITAEVVSINWDLTLHREEEHPMDLMERLANWEECRVSVPDNLLREVAPEIFEVWRAGVSRALICAD